MEKKKYKHEQITAHKPMWKGSLWRPMKRYKEISLCHKA